MKLLNIYRANAESRLQEQAARAAKLGLDFEYSLSEPIMQEGKEWVVVEFSAPKVCLAGYEFVAVQKRSGDAHLLLSAPGVMLESADREVSNTCDHCNTNRNRNTVYLVRDTASGEVKRVGSTCVQDYLGQDVATTLAQFQYVLELDELRGELEEGSERVAGFAVATSEAIKAALASIKKFGWVSRARERDTGIESTATSVLLKFTRPDCAIDVSNVADADVEAVVNWAKQLPVESEYDHNLVSTLTSGSLDLRVAASISFLCAAVNAYLNSLNKQDDVDSKHFGEEKVRYRGLEATLTFSKCLGEGDYGMRYMYVFHCQGSDLVWYTTKYLELETGATLTLDFTVKRHSDYRGRLQTEVTRVKVH